MLLLALTAPLPFGLFMALRFLEGAAHIAALSTLLGIAGRARPESQRGRVMGLVGGGITLGVAIGAPIGGVIGRENPLIPLYAGSALVALAAMVAWRALKEPHGGAERASAAEISSALRANPLLLAPLAFAFVDRFTVGFYTTTFSLFLSRIHGMSPPRIGLLMALLMLPFGLLSYPFGRLAERWSRVAMMSLGSLVYGVGTAAVGLVYAAGAAALDARSRRRLGSHVRALAPHHERRRSAAHPHDRDGRLQRGRLTRLHSRPRDGRIREPGGGQPRGLGSGLPGRLRCGGPLGDRLRRARPALPAAAGACRPHDLASRASASPPRRPC